MVCRKPAGNGLPQRIKGSRHVAREESEELPGQLWELQETGHFPEPQFPVLWNGVAALGWGAAGRSLALVQSQLSGGGAGFRVVGWRQIALR